MSLKVPNVGELILLGYLKADEAEAWLLHLYTNDYTPVDGSVLGDFTPANFSGYAAQVLTGWGGVSTVSGRARMDSALKTFTHNGGATANDIYGWYVTDGAGVNLIMAERCPGAPVNLANVGDNLGVLIYFTLKTEF